MDTYFFPSIFVYYYYVQLDTKSNNEHGGWFQCYFLSCYTDSKQTYRMMIITPTKPPSTKIGNDFNHLLMLPFFKDPYGPFTITFLAFLAFALVLFARGQILFPQIWRKIQKFQCSTTSYKFGSICVIRDREALLGCCCVTWRFYTQKEEIVACVADK